MDMREQFEEWIRSYIGETWLKRNAPEPDEYLDENTQFMWEAWQASRKAITIELPVIVDKDWACSEDECESMRQGITMTKHKINAAGIRTK